MSPGICPHKPCYKKAGRIYVFMDNHMNNFSENLQSSLCMSSQVARDQHLVSGDLKKNTGRPAGHPALLLGVQRCGKAGDWFWSIASVPWTKKCLCTTRFLYFSSSFVPHELTWNVIFTSRLTSHVTSHVGNRKYNSLQVWYSVSIVVDSTASNYLYRTIFFLSANFRDLAATVCKQFQ